jgi:tetratricopeptide (TPR) repeat protein
MLNREQDSPKALIGASIPRSGHHYLQRMLSLYFADQIFYCEVYSQQNCCKQVPCTRRGGFRVTYQKSHDRDFALNPDVADALYLVQYRHPVPEALSDRELDLRDGLGRRNLGYRKTREYYGWWLASKAHYYRRFHDKWFARRVPNAAYLDYALLAQDPMNSIAPIIQWVSGDIDVGRLSKAVAQGSATRAPLRQLDASETPPAATAFTPRVVESSPHFDRDLLAPFEAYVLAHCPKFGFTSELGGNSYGDHWLYGLILGHDEDEPLPDGEADRLDAAARRAPGHPEIAFRLAKRELDRDAPEKAIAILDETIARHPTFGHGYRLLAQACKAADQPMPASTMNADALLACSESPSILVDIAQAMLAEGIVVNAIAALSVATVLEPENYRANHMLAKALSTQGRWAQARRYAEHALELKPANKQTQRLLEKIKSHAKPRTKPAAVA